MAYLFRLERFKQSMRLGFYRAWNHEYPSLCRDISFLHHHCPKLMDLFVLYNNIPPTQENKTQPSGRINPREIMRDEQIVLPYDNVALAQNYNFITKVIAAYSRAYHVQLETLHDSSTFTFYQAVHFDDQLVLSITNSIYTTNLFYGTMCRRKLMIGDFVEYNSRFYRVLCCLEHVFQQQSFYFLYVRRLEQISYDEIICLHVYSYTLTCEVLGLFECSHKPLFFINSSSPTGSPSSSSITMNLCTWDIDIM